MTSIAPSKEAVDAIVQHLNSGTFSTEFVATATDIPTLELSDAEWLRVEVVHEEEETPVEMFDADVTRHAIQVHITARRRPGDMDSTADVKLLRSQIARYLDQWSSDDNRVQIWFVARESVPDADKQALREMNLYRGSLSLTVEVPP